MQASATAGVRVGVNVQAGASLGLQVEGKPNEGLEVKNGYAQEEAAHGTTPEIILPAREDDADLDSKLLEQLTSCVKRAIQPGAPAINVADLDKLPSVFPKPQDLLQAKVLLSQFLAHNPEILPRSVLRLVTSAAIFIGQEKAGKSRTLAAVIGRPVLFSQQDLATRCPTQLWVYQDNTLEPNSPELCDVIPAVKQTGSQLHKNVTPFVAAEMVAKEMKAITGIREDVCDVQIRCPHPVLPRMCFDMPGITGMNHVENKFGFREASLSLSRNLVREWVLPQQSDSWAFVVTRCFQAVQNEDWGTITTQNGVSCTRVGVVLTRVDEVKAESLVSRMREGPFKECGDRALVQIFTGPIHVLGEYTKQWPIWLVCNPEYANPQGAMNEQWYQTAKQSIEEEINITTNSRTAAFVGMIEKIRQSPGYNINQEKWDEFKSMIGVGKLREFVQKITVKSAQKEIKFVEKFLQDMINVKEQQSNLLQKEIDKLGSTGGRPEKVLERLLQTGAHLVYHIMTGANLPSSSDKKNDLVEYPTTQQWEQVKDTRKRSLREEAIPVRFPNELDEKLEEHLLKNLDPHHMQTFATKIRLMRFCNSFFIRSMLCAPVPATREQIMASATAGAEIETISLAGFLESKVQAFITERLGSHARAHITSGIYEIMKHSMESVLLLLEKMPTFKMYLTNAGNRPARQPSIQEVKAGGQPKPSNDMFDKSDGVTLLRDDLLGFLVSYICKPVIDNVERECQKAAAAMETPIVPSLPTLVGLTSVLLPAGMDFQQEYFARRRDLSGLQGAIVNARHNVMKLVAHQARLVEAEGTSVAGVKSGATGGAPVMSSTSGPQPVTSTAPTGSVSGPQPVQPVVPRPGEIKGPQPVGVPTPASPGSGAPIPTTAGPVPVPSNLAPKPSIAGPPSNTVTVVHSGGQQRPKGPFEGARDPTEKEWEWLSTPEAKAKMIEMLSNVVPVLAGPNAVGNARSLTTIFDDEVAEVNHGLLMHTRTVVQLFCYQLLLVLPKCYRAWTRPYFLGDNITQDFWDFLLNERVRGMKAEFKAEDDKQAEQALAQQQYQQSLQGSTDGPMLGPESMFRKKGNNKKVLTEDQIMRLVEKRYGLKSPIVRLEREKADLEKEMDDLKRAAGSVSRLLARIRENPQELIRAIDNPQLE